MYEQFQDVGLMTGDVAINPSASCLVMTTEVCLIGYVVLRTYSDNILSVTIVMYYVPFLFT